MFWNQKSKEREIIKFWNMNCCSPNITNLTKTKKVFTPFYLDWNWLHLRMPRTVSYRFPLNVHLQGSAQKRLDKWECLSIGALHYSQVWVSQPCLCWSDWLRWAETSQFERWIWPHRRCSDRCRWEGGDLGDEVQRRTSRSLSHFPLSAPHWHQPSQGQCSDQVQPEAELQCLHPRSALFSTNNKSLDLSRHKAHFQWKRESLQELLYWGEFMIYSKNNLFVRWKNMSSWNLVNMTLKVALR